MQSCLSICCWCLSPLVSNTFRCMHNYIALLFASQYARPFSGLPNASYVNGTEQTTLSVTFRRFPCSENRKPVNPQSLIVTYARHKLPACLLYIRSTGLAPSLAGYLAIRVKYEAGIIDIIIIILITRLVVSLRLFRSQEDQRAIRSTARRLKKFPWLFSWNPLLWACPRSSPRPLNAT